MPVATIMVILFDKTSKISVTGGDIWDYPMPSEEIGISFQIHNGRGPEKGKYINTVCHEMYFIISGTATFYIGDKKYEAKENDLVIIEPNVPCYFEANNLKYITITRPNWYEEQYKGVETE